MKKRSEWSQRDSDLLAHFFDAVECIKRSSWRSSKISFGITHPLDTELPTHEQFIFAATCFRRFFNNDTLAKRSRDTYLRFSNSRTRSLWIDYEYSQAKHCWFNPPPLTMAVVGVRPTDFGEDVPPLGNLFDAFTYGAFVFHSGDHTKSNSYDRLTRLLESCDKNILLGLLHGGLAMLLNHLSHMAHVVYQDYKLWFNEDSLPPPRVHWQHQLLNADRDDSLDFAFTRPSE